MESFNWQQTFPFNQAKKSYFTILVRQNCTIKQQEERQGSDILVSWHIAEIWFSFGHDKMICPFTPISIEYQKKHLLFDYVETRAQCF